MSTYQACSVEVRLLHTYLGQVSKCVCLVRLAQLPVCGGWISIGMNHD